MGYSITRTASIFLAVVVLAASTLACNIPSTPQVPSESVANVTATESKSLEEPTAELSPTNDNDTTEDGNSEDSNSAETGEGDLPLTGADTIRDSVSIKNGNKTYEGNISFPGSNTNDEITIKPIDFDSTKTSGQLVFTLTCSGRGKAKVNYKGGAVRSGAPGCGETWAIYVINGSPDSHISIRLDASGDVNWMLSVVSGE